MKHYMNALATELMKLRRTLAFWCILIGPTALTVLMFAAQLSRKPAAFDSGINAWQSAIDNGLGLWAILFLPLYAALQSTLLAQLEHANQQWKYLYTLPVPRFAFFAAKWSLLILVMASTHLLLMVETIAGGKLLQAVQPVWGFDAPIPWGTFLQGWAALTLSSVLISTVQLLVSLWWRSFIPSLGLGLVAAMSNIFILSSDAYHGYDPYLMPILALRGEGSEPQVALIAGLSLGLLLALVGGWGFTRKRVA